MPCIHPRRRRIESGSHPGGVPNRNCLKKNGNMADIILVPKYDKSKGDDLDQAPCWVPLLKCINWKERQEAREANLPIPSEVLKRIKPIIVCNCKERLGLRAHHVHSDGRVTQSFYHRDEVEGDNKGCGWHVYIVLQDWSGEDLPPGE